MPFVTILTPVYNGIEYLEECVCSVIEQTYVDWEILIGVNGHGPDGGDVGDHAKQIASKDTRIKVIIQPPSIKGKVDSLNDLMTYTTSEWICILDCDDKWHPNKLAAQIHALQTDARDAVVIGTHCQYFGDIHDIVHSLPIGYIDPAILEHMNPIINSSALVNRVYCKWEYNDINYGMEDYYLWCEICLLNKKLYNIGSVLTYHRVHVTSSFNSKGYSNEAIRVRYKHLRLHTSYQKGI